MIELLIFAAGAATGAVAVLLPLNRALTERDMLQATKDSLAIDVEQLKARANTLRGDNLSLQNEVKRLGTENVELQREAGRYAAELRAANQRLAKFERERGKGGRFTRKDPPKPKPIPCA